MTSVSLRRRVAYHVGQLGTVGIAGLLLLLLTGVAWVLPIQSIQEEIASTTAQLRALQQQNQARIAMPVDTSLSREQQLQEFYGGFPSTMQVNDVLQTIYKAAAKRNLVLETGEYAWVQTNADPVARYKVTFPIKGTFAQLLEFMDTVLQENNTVALENLTIKRDKVETPELEAKLTFTIFAVARK